MWQGNQSKNESFGGGGAGGFVKGESPSASQGASANKTKRSDNVVPVTVAFMHHCMQNYDRVKIGNIDIATVKIIGLVRSISQAASNITYEIDDLTGKPLTVKRWQDSASSDRFMPVENTYVVIIGNMRTFQGKHMLTALKVRPLNSLNELTAHLLEVMHAKISLERGVNVEMANVAGGSHVPSATGFASGAGGTTADDSSNPHGLNPQQLKVYNIIKSNISEAGCSTDDICRQLNNQSRDSIKKIIEFMSGEGHIYSTVDEDHFKTTDC